MAVDASVWNNANAGGSFANGMKMGDMLRQRRIEAAERDKAQKYEEAMKSGLVTNPDGTTSFDQGKAYSASALIDPMKAMQQKQAWEEQAAAKGQREFDQKLKTDQFALQQGADQRASEQELWERDMAMKKFGLEREKMMASKSAAGATGENLPIDQKRVVTDLSAKNASKLSIKNQIDAVMGGWDELSDDQKVATGRSLLKTLNSTEGADAIGAEEAKRLGGKLEFAMGNLSPWNSNPIQFGRDLNGFAEQARNQSASIGKAIESNQSIIDKNMGRKGEPESKTYEGVTYLKIDGRWVPR